MAFHGTPGSRLQMATFDLPMQAAGIRFVCPDRPGYGLSTFQPGRRLVDWPRDVAHLADHMEIDRFALIGVSGGGPHAAACAAVLGSRITSLAVVSGVGRLGDPAAIEGMTRANRLFTELLRHRSFASRAVIDIGVDALCHWPERVLDFWMRYLPPSDVAVLSRPQVRSMAELDAVRSPRTVGRSAAQDFELFASDWGFDLASIEVPVDIWQGEADRNVPPQHARLLHAAIPGSVLHEIVGEGHFMMIDHIAEISAALEAA
jgi:pimeloyl-ACP methyl ester carboxylesterase